MATSASMLSTLFTFFDGVDSRIEIRKRDEGVHEEWFESKVKPEYRRYHRLL